MFTTSNIALLVVLGLAGLGNPVGLGNGPNGIPSYFTLREVQERIHFRGEGKILRMEGAWGGVC